MSNTNTRFFPKGSIKVTPKGLDVVIGLYEYVAKGDDQKWFGFIAYSGKSGKPDVYSSFRSLTTRDETIGKYLDGIRKANEWKAARKANRVLTENPVKIGDVFYTSWGYDQTNVEFFQVVGVKGGSVELREVAQEYEQTGDMSGNVSPRKDNFLDKSPILKKRVLTYDGGKSIYLKISDSRSAWVYDNRPKYSSSYA